MKTKTDELDIRLCKKLIEPLMKSGSWGTITHVLIPGVGIIKILKNAEAKLLKGKKIKDRHVEIELKNNV